MLYSEPTWEVMVGVTDSLSETQAESKGFRWFVRGVTKLADSPGAAGSPIDLGMVLVELERLV